MTPVQMSTEDKAELLEATPWTKELTWNHVVALAGYTQVLQIREGKTVFREHDRDAYMCFVINGQVGIFKEDSKLGQKELVNLGSGKTFGEIAVLDNQPRSATVIAKEDSRLMVLGKDGLEHLCEDRPKLANKLMWALVKVVTGRLRQTSGALVDSL